jgi:hypothetical protein
MPASDHLHPELFHGTGHFFGEGETINPPEAPASGKLYYSRAAEYTNDFSPVVYMTSNKHIAENYATKKAYESGMLFAPIYSVEHSPDIINLAEEAERRHPTPPGKYEPHDTFSRETYVSKKPVKPKEIVGWGTNNFVGFA